jgi:hypothetical protein
MKSNHKNPQITQITQIIVGAEILRVGIRGSVLEMFLLFLGRAEVPKRNLRNL